MFDCNLTKNDEYWCKPEVVFARSTKQLSTFQVRKVAQNDAKRPMTSWDHLNKDLPLGQNPDCTQKSIYYSFSTNNWLLTIENWADVAREKCLFLAVENPL